MYNNCYSLACVWAASGPTPAFTPAILNFLS